LRAATGGTKLASTAAAPITNRRRPCSASKVLDSMTPWPDIKSGTRGEESLHQGRKVGSFKDSSLSKHRRSRGEIRYHHDNRTLRFHSSEREYSDSDKRFLSRFRSPSRSRTPLRVRNWDQIASTGEKQGRHVHDIERHRGRKRNRDWSPTSDTESLRLSAPSIDMLWSIVDAECISDEDTSRSRSLRSSYRGSVSTSRSVRSGSGSTLSRTLSIASSTSSDENTLDYSSDADLAYPLNPATHLRSHNQLLPPLEPIDHQLESQPLTAESEHLSNHGVENKVEFSYGVSCKRCLQFHIKCDRRHPACSACTKSANVLECSLSHEQAGRSDEASETRGVAGGIGAQARWQLEAGLEPERLPLNLELHTGSFEDENTATPSPFLFMTSKHSILHKAYLLGKRMARPVLRNGFERVEWFCVSAKYLLFTKLHCSGHVFTSKSPFHRGIES
jgi:hypothetical protein